MARIAGVDLPRKKQVGIALRYIYGLGPTNSLKVLAQAGVDPRTKTDDLTEGEVARIREVIDSGEYKVEGDLRREVAANIKALMDAMEKYMFYWQ